MLAQTAGSGQRIIISKGAGEVRLSLVKRPRGTRARSAERTRQILQGMIFPRFRGQSVKRQVFLGRPRLGPIPQRGVDPLAV